MFSWQDEHGSVLTILLKVGSISDIFWISLKAKFKNLIVNDNFPDEPNDDEILNAYSNEMTEKQFTFKLDHQKREMMLEFTTIARNTTGTSTSWNFSEISSASMPCLYCQLPVGIEIENTYSGTFYKEGDGRVHSECYDDFRIGKADKCEYCNEPVVKIEGKFTGAYYTSDKNGKVHGECWHDYQVE